MYREQLLEEREAVELLKSIKPINVRQYQELAKQNHEMLGEYLKRISPELVMHKLSKSEQLKIKLEQNINVLKKDSRMRPEYIEFYRYIFKCAKIEPNSPIFSIEHYAQKSGLDQKFVRAMSEYMLSKEYIDFCVFTDGRCYWHIRSLDRYMKNSEVPQQRMQSWDEYKSLISAQSQNYSDIYV